jgi:hypothetical protein
MQPGADRDPRICADRQRWSRACSLLAPKLVNRRGFIGRTSPGIVFALALWAQCVSCDGRETPVARPRIVAEREATATVLFPKGESELAAHLTTIVDELVERAGSGSPAAVVLGFANEHDDLIANLALAERRAQAIASELVTRGVPKDRIVVAGSEARSNEENASRVEVIIVAGARIAMLEPVSPNVMSRSSSLRDR